MPVESATDRETLLADFGVDVVADGSTIKGIFEHEHDSEFAGGTVSFSIQSAMVHCRSTDVSTVGQGETVTVDGNSYAVTDVQPDGTGMTVLHLEAQ